MGSATSGEISVARSEVGQCSTSQRAGLNERYLPSPITSYERETAAEVYQRQDRGVSTVRRYRLHRDIKSVAERLPRRGRLSGYVQELSCLSTTHKEK
jgi:hypothetical protein